MKVSLVFDVTFHGEPGAGLNPYYNTVTVTVDPDPGGETGEFGGFIRSALAEWFDGAGVDLREETHGA